MALTTSDGPGRRAAALFERGDRHTCNPPAKTADVIATRHPIPMVKHQMTVASAHGRKTTQTTPHNQKRKGLQ